MLLSNYIIGKFIEQWNHVASIDTTIAFSSLSRAELISCSKETILEEYVKWAYAKHSELLLDATTRITSQSGVQQWDPFGMTLFSITLSKPLQAIQSRFPNVTIPAYADDIYLIQNPQEIEQAADALSAELRKYGLIRNQNKSKNKAKT